MRLFIYALTDSSKILSGAQSGRNLFSKLVEKAMPQGNNPEPIFLDFGGVDVATASFLRESLIAFRDYTRSTLPALFPVVANASSSVIEELDFFLRHRKDGIWVCALGELGDVRCARLLGELDEAHRITLEMVVRLKSATAPTLAAQSREGNAISPTAWNNRLAFLTARGLLMELRSGKTKTFVPVLEVA